ncbi:MAG TPA: M3 family metallopeptidase [Galbitalea sp.]|nr:M3 family metallopeptidase [Galbitalea sp.]
MTLDAMTLPASASEWPDFIRDWSSANLRRSEVAISTLTDGSTRSAQEVLDLWNESEIGLSSASWFVGLLAEVHPDEHARELADERDQASAKAATDRGLNVDLYHVIEEVDASGLDSESRRLLDKLLLDFRRGGVNLDEASRGRIGEISERSVRLDQDFSRVIRDDVRSIRILPEQLEGLPADYVAAHPTDDDGVVTITTDYPDSIPFRMFAADGEARRRLQQEFLNRGWPENDELLGQLLELRNEHATLLGYASWPDFDAEVKMVRSGDAIGEFINRVAAAADGPGRRDRERLLARLHQDRPDATTIDAADSLYYTELVRRESFDVDSQELRPYFEAERVIQGLLGVTGRLFGLEYTEVFDAPSWHSDVRVFDVAMEGARIARIQLDLHPREGKFKHAAMFPIRVGIPGLQLAEGALACNLPRGLMEHADVTTLFHEFGHLVHHILANGQKYATFAGIGTEWDFVEAPSQMLEEWAWDPDVLATFAINDAGEPIPAELVKRMRAADAFGNGLYARTQTFYAAVSYLLHRDRPGDRTAEVQRLQAQYDLNAYIEGTHFQASFGHLTGYSSAYYTYLWSLVIAKDLFSAFNPADLFDQSVAARYRDDVLAKGGSRDAAELVRDFLGRDYSFVAFATWLNG